MKRAIVCFLTLAAAYLTISGITPGPVFSTSNVVYHGMDLLPEGYYRNTLPNFRYVSENSDETDKVNVIGCDGTVWESSTGITKGQAELRGTWIGHETDRTEKWSVTFTDSGTFELKGPGNEWYDGKYACDSNQDPKQLNFYIKQSGNPAHIGKTCLIIYKIDMDTLTFASSEPGVKTRPNSLTPSNGARVLVFGKKQ